MLLVVFCEDRTIEMFLRFRCLDLNTRHNHSASLRFCFQGCLQRHLDFRAADKDSLCYFNTCIFPVFFFMFSPCRRRTSGRPPFTAKIRMNSSSIPSVVRRSQLLVYPSCKGKGILSETVMAAYLLFLIVVSCSPYEKRQRRGCRLSERNLPPSPLSGK